MESFSSEDDYDQLSERFERYSLSADVSESESSTNLSCPQYENDGAASSSFTSSPLAGLIFADNSLIPAPATGMLPVIGGRDLVIPAAKTERSETSLSGEFWIVLVIFLGQIVMFFFFCKIWGRNFFFYFFFLLSPQNFNGNWPNFYMFNLLAIC